MNYKHPNLFVMIPYEERNRVSGYFDLSVVGEEYAKLLGDLTDELSTYAVSKNDVGENMADGIREDGYLLPYNGDTGDRLYGVRENEYVI